MIDNYIIRDGSILKRLIRFLESSEFKTLCDDKAMEVLIRPYKEKKTGEQEAFFHVLCRELSKATGYTEGEIKEYIKRDVFGQREIRIGDRTTSVGISSSKLPREQYSELIEGAYRVGADAGVQLPAPRYTH